MKYFLLLTLLAACTSDAPTYSREEFLDMAREGDPNLKLVAPKSISHAVINCSDYKPSCRYGVKVIVKNLEMGVLFYEKPKDALKAAKRIKGYISRNWVLDDVRGEPVLERFVVKYLKAEPAFTSKD